MAEYIDREKIKTCFAQIIVNNSEGKPYYSIMYWENGEMNIGFSSYKLDYVRRWLNEEFEVKRNVDVVPVVRCKDCEWFMREHGCPIEASGYHKGGRSLPVENDFCSYGERMDGGAGNV